MQRIPASSCATLCYANSLIEGRRSGEVTRPLREDVLQELGIRGIGAFASIFCDVEQTTAYQCREMSARRGPTAVKTAGYFTGIARSPIVNRQENLPARRVRQRGKDGVRYLDLFDSLRLRH